MRKLFLSIMLMTLLPLAGWATDVIVKPVNIEPTYGAVVPVTGQAVSPDWFTYETEGEALSEDQLATLAGCLDFDTYDQTIKKVGAYTYTLTIKEQGLAGYTIKVQGTGNVVVKRKPLSAVDVLWTNPVADLTFSGSEQTPDIAASTTIYGEAG